MTREEAKTVAQGWLRRAERRAVLVKTLGDQDALGLECSETVELDRLASEDVKACAQLARYVLEEASG